MWIPKSARLFFGLDVDYMEDKIEETETVLYLKRPWFQTVKSLSQYFDNFILKYLSFLWFRKVCLIAIIFKAYIHVQNIIKLDYQCNIHAR